MAADASVVACGNEVNRASASEEVDGCSPPTSIVLAIGGGEVDNDGNECGAEAGGANGT
jgi:hypothetical protein